MTSVLEESGRPTKACGPMQAVAGHGEIKLRPTKRRFTVSIHSRIRPQSVPGFLKARSGQGEERMASAIGEAVEI